MSMRSMSGRWILGWILSTGFIGLRSQENDLAGRRAAGAPPSATASAQPDYVVRSHRVRLAFQSDGTSERLEEARILVKTEAGVNALGQLHWGYNAANETLEVVAVKVNKADGRTVMAGSEAVQDVAPPGIEQVPMYTDLRLKLVTVPALRPGDELVFTLRTPSTTPYAPGHFWGEHRFSREEIVESETFELDVPIGKVVKVQSSQGIVPTVRETAGRRVHRWSWSHLRMEDEGQNDSSKAKRNLPKPDLQFTTFGSWVELGDWYAGLEAPQRVPDETLRAKASELVAGKATALEKIRALYSFVATTNRYVSLSFGLGRFQPHRATEVLANQYGDCKDKHTLLASLLEAEGFKVSAVLIGSGRTLDPTLPSPAQFDHALTAVDVGGETVLMDTTAEVAPFRALLQPLRRKQALLVAPRGGSRIITTPASNPVPDRVELSVEGELSGTGDLKATVMERFEGDPEVVLRSVFRRVPQPRWKSMVSLNAARNGLWGDLGEPQVSDPSDLKTPLVLTYGLTKGQEYKPSGGSGFMMVPLHRIKLESAVTESGALSLGGGTLTCRLRLRLPDGVVPTLPLGIQVKRDFATYRSVYAFEGGTLQVDRELAILALEIPSTREADLEAFRKLLEKDQGTFMDFKGELVRTQTAGEDVGALTREGHTAYEAKDYRKALALWQKVAALNAKDKDVWNNLGRAHHALGAFDKAMAAYQKAIELNPNEEYAFNNLGLTLWALGRQEEAAAMFRRQLDVNPYDPYAHGNLGRLLMSQGRSIEAAPELRLAVTVNPKDAALRVMLGEALLTNGDKDQGSEALEEAMKLELNPGLRNNTAYALAKRGLALPRARELATSAVADTCAALEGLSEASDPFQAGILTASLASFWDTLGWVHVQQGNLTEALPYLEAAWGLSQSSEAGLHLGKVLLTQGERERAAKILAMAAATARPLSEARRELQALVGGEKAAKRRIQAAQEALIEARTYALSGPHPPRSTHAEFLLLLTPEGKIQEARFLDGDASLRGASGIIKTLRHRVPLPNEKGARAFLRAVVVSDPSSRTYSMILMTTDAVNLLTPPGIAKALRAP